MPGVSRTRLNCLNSIRIYNIKNIDLRYKTVLVVYICVKLKTLPIKSELIFRIYIIATLKMYNAIRLNMRINNEMLYTSESH